MERSFEPPAQFEQVELESRLEEDVMSEESNGRSSVDLETKEV